MELEQYRILIQVIETGNLTTAAKQLNYTVSGVSRMISAIEKKLGFSLFIRSHGGVIPTKECNLMLPYLRKFVFAGDACLQAASRICNLETGSITISGRHTALITASSLKSFQISAKSTRTSRFR